MRYLVALFYLSILGWGGFVWAEPNAKIAANLASELRRHAKVDALIYLKGDAGILSADRIVNRDARIGFVQSQLTSLAQRSQGPLVRWLKSKGIVHRTFHIENAILVSGVTAKTVRAIAGFSQVRTLAANVRAHFWAGPMVNGPRASGADIPDHLSAIGVDRVWRELGVKGRGIVIAGQDTGYYWEHDALKRHYRGLNSFGVVDHNYNWHDAIPSTNSPIPFDDTGHGTHTMGTMIGDDGGVNKIGVAPEAQWIGCRNMDKGVGSLASYLECFEFFLAPYPLGGDPRTQGRPDMAPHIVNNSWTCSPAEGCQGGELLGAVRALKAAGIFVVAAAGNYGPNCGSMNRAPAFYSRDLIAVGAYNRYRNELIFFSSRGPSSWTNEVAPQLVAYGDAILSSVIGGPAKYEEKMGTSMAAPQIAGVVALLWSARPDLIGQIEHTTQILQTTARPLLSADSCPGYPGSAVPNVSFGYGMVDAYAAIKASPKL